MVSPFYRLIRRNSITEKTQKGLAIYYLNRGNIEFWTIILLEFILWGQGYIVI